LNITDGVGIEVTAGSNLEASLIPLKFTLKAAYASITGEGNAFLNFHPFDFDFNNSSSISIEQKNLTVEVDDPNTIIVTINDLDFVLKLSGFNQAERVVVKVKY